MISVAAELAEMHPQTLRMYERRGLIRPQRSSKSTRLYSMDDVERLRHIQRLVAEGGLNLAGVERVLEMEEQLEAMQRRLERSAGRHGALGRPGASEELEAVHRSYRKELVPFAIPGEVSWSPGQRRAAGERRLVGVERSSQPGYGAAVRRLRRPMWGCPGARAALRQSSRRLDRGHVQLLREARSARIAWSSRR